VGSHGPGRAGDDASPAFADGTPAAVRLKDYFTTTEGRSGRLDDYSKLGLAAVALALGDAGLDSWDAKRKGALVAATGFGCLATDGSYFETALDEGGALASPNLFAYTLPNCFVGEAALRFGLTGPTFVLSGEAQKGSRLKALAEGVALLLDGEARFAVCGFCDMGAPEFLTAQGAASGVASGGAAFFVLEDEDRRGGDATLSSSPSLAGLTLRGSEVIQEGVGPVEDVTQFISDICKRSKSGQD
jgi:3-oxoacyl-[acyl-carrier-protein] synthase II